MEKKWLIVLSSRSPKVLESEFKAQAGPNWFAKKISENTFQMRFPTAKKVEELSFFTGMQMGTVPDVTFKVELWNPNVGAKSKLETAWFRIFGIPLEKRNDKKVSFVASLVGLPMEIDKNNLKRWEFARAKIGCRDITKVPAVVEGLLDFHFYDFVFQREVPVEGVTNATGTKWTRNSDRQKDDNPSPKKPRWGNSNSGGDNSGSGQAGPEMSGDKTNDNGKATDEDAAQQDKGVRSTSEKPNGSLPQSVTENTRQGRDLDGHKRKRKESLPQSVTENNRQGRDLDGHKRKGKDIVTEHSDSESSDQGLCFDDIISPSGETSILEPSITWKSRTYGLSSSVKMSQL